MKWGCQFKENRQDLLPFFFFAKDKILVVKQKSELWKTSITMNLRASNASKTFFDQHGGYINEDNFFGIIQWNMSTFGRTSIF